MWKGMLLRCTKGGGDVVKTCACATKTGETLAAWARLAAAANGGKREGDEQGEEDDGGKSRGWDRPRGCERGGEFKHEK